MTQFHFIQNLLQVKDPNIQFQNKSDEVMKNNRKAVLFYGNLDKFSDVCVSCGHVSETSQDMIRNGGFESDVHLGMFNRTPCYLRLRKQRYLCKHCRATTTAQTSLVGYACFISKDVKRIILSDLSEMKAMTLIAREFAVSTSTVLRCLKDYRSTQLQRPTTLPTHLAVDEFKSVKAVEGQMSGILMDNEKKQIFDILPDRKQRHLREYFLRFSREERYKVETITMDMYSPYYQFFQTLFPKSDIIIDRFHIVQHLLRELNKYRVTIMNGFRTTHRRVYNKFKRYWKLLLKNPSDLHWRHYQRFPLFDWLTHTQGIVDYLLDQSPAFKASYDCIQMFVMALRKGHQNRFFDLLRRFLKAPLPQNIKKGLRTLKKFEVGIRNSFIYTYTNGPLEGTNNKIKTLKRTGFGYRNFLNLKTRILLTTRYKEVKETLPDPPYQWMVEASERYNSAS